MIPVETIEKEIEFHRERGTRLVDSMDFKESAHVLHYKMFPKLYKDKLDEFLKASQSSSSNGI